MKIINLTCNNCGAQLKVNANLKKCMCPYCGNEALIDDEVVHHKIDDGFNFGYQAEMGRLKAQQDMAKKQQLMKQQELAEQQEAIRQQQIAFQQTIAQQNSARKPDKIVALALCMFLGFFGIHKFYEGKTCMGILYLLTFGLFGIGWIVDIILLLIDVISEAIKKCKTSENDQYQDDCQGMPIGDRDDTMYKTHKFTTLSIVALVTSILGFTSIIGLILGIVDIIKNKEANHKLSIIAIAIGSLITIALFV